MPGPGSSERPDWQLAVVVGAGGMGTAVARRLSQRYRILLADIDAERADGVATALRHEGGDATSIRCDVTDPASVALLASRAADLGGVRVLAHVAGLSPSMADFSTIIRVNLNGPAFVAEAVLPEMLAGSAAIFVASLAAHNFTPDAEITALLREATSPNLADDLAQVLGHDRATPAAAYQLSKYGLRMLCRRDSSAWGARGARIISLSPGLIATPQGALEFEKREGKRRLFAATPLAREGTMLEIADAFEFLASDRASFISGTDLLVDGGLSGRMSESV